MNQLRLHTNCIPHPRELRLKSHVDRVQNRNQSTSQKEKATFDAHIQRKDVLVPGNIWDGSYSTAGNVTQLTPDMKSWAHLGRSSLGPGPVQAQHRSDSEILGAGPRRCQQVSMCQWRQLCLLCAHFLGQHLLRSGHSRPEGAGPCLTQERT